MQSTLRRGIEAVRRGDRCGVWGGGTGSPRGAQEDRQVTYPDDHGLVAFEFGDEFVPAKDLRLVERPEPAHHFDAAFGWIRHLRPLQRGGAGGAGWVAWAALARWYPGGGRAPHTAAHRPQPPTTPLSSSSPTRQLGPGRWGAAPRVRGIPPSRNRILLPGPPARARGPPACARSTTRPPAVLAMLRPAGLRRAQPFRIPHQHQPPPRPARPSAAPARPGPPGGDVTAGPGPPPRGYERGAPRDM